jgi:hypothetical protein
MSFHKKEQEYAKKNKNPASASNGSGSDNKKCKGKKKENTNKKIRNKNQVPEFMMNKGKTWEKTFQGKFPESRVKFMGTYMCPQFHTRGDCWSKGCKYKKSHVPSAGIPDNKKQAYITYMAECRRKSSIKKGIRLGPSGTNHA